MIKKLGIFICALAAIYAIFLAIAIKQEIKQSKNEHADIWSDTAIVVMDPDQNGNTKEIACVAQLLSNGDIVVIHHLERVNRRLQRKDMIRVEKKRGSKHWEVPEVNL
jgi:hypothetical protein